MNINIKVIPKSKINKIIKENDGSYKIKITTAPEQGRANAMALKLLAKELQVSVSNLTIIQGLTNRKKLVKINNK